tara:strand:- start:288 stop:491 length:204 start_codon:yes stop_codon:yes gene_type:complete
MQIEENIPVPPKTRTSKYRDQFQKMKRGDSIFVDTKEDVDRLRRMMQYYGHKPTYRAENGGFRIWKI